MIKKSLPIIFLAGSLFAHSALADDAQAMTQTVISSNTVTQATAPVHMRDTHTFDVTLTPKTPGFLLHLKANPTTGYSWQLQEVPAALEVAAHQYVPFTNEKLVGAGGYEDWYIRIKPEALSTKTKVTLHFVYARPWQKDEAADKKTVEVTLAP